MAGIEWVLKLDLVSENNFMSRQRMKRTSYGIAAKFEGMIAVSAIKVNHCIIYFILIIAVCDNATCDNAISDTFVTI